MVVKGMEERISRTAQAQFDAVTKNIESANAAMEQVRAGNQPTCRDQWVCCVVLRVLHSHSVISSSIH